ncbi:uncharacterized protein J8A68_001477 [[Candida] subhashii]|uniref:Uncharacterized protein n=1 Tax=[Candida] subhashii TaxID=561895 RepID=A0A8J5URY4_9ASCO|nr:uncharacterized protein J8A68_001477 [[Candida] subhashii]KAG7665012.1 hypothetical protein J8A68_001477 [[Candida] subhashii]
MSTFNDNTSCPSYDPDLTITNTNQPATLPPYEPPNIHRDLLKLVSITNCGYPNAISTTNPYIILEQVSGSLQRMRNSEELATYEIVKDAMDYFDNHGLDKLIQYLICPMIEDLKDVEIDWRRLNGAIETIYEFSILTYNEVSPIATTELLKVLNGVKMSSIKRINDDYDEDMMMVGSSSSGAAKLEYKYVNHAIRIILTTTEPMVDLFHFIETWLCEAPTRTEVGNCALYFSDLSITLKDWIKTQGPLEGESKILFKESYLSFIKSIRDCPYKEAAWSCYKQIKEDYCEIFGELFPDSEVRETAVLENSHIKDYKKADYDPGNENNLDKSKVEDIQKWLKNPGVDLETANEFENEGNRCYNYPSETPVLELFDEPAYDDRRPSTEFKKTKFRWPFKELFKRRNGEDHHHHLHRRHHHCRGNRRDGLYHHCHLNLPRHHQQQQHQHSWKFWRRQKEAPIEAVDRVDTECSKK